MSVPNDPVILLSYLNTQLRDNYNSLHEFCLDHDEDEEFLCGKLSIIDYHYNAQLNQFI